MRRKLPRAAARLTAGVLWSVAATASAAAEGGGDAPEFVWSATLIGEYQAIASPQDDDAVGGFFDQYRYTSNKSRSFPFEVGVRDASFDWNPNAEPRVRFRFESPTSNLGISGSSVEGPFLNQRALLQGRLEGVRFDVEYRRLRTEQLREFPETAGSPLPFTDLTALDDRFFRDRSGFAAEARWRVHEAVANATPEAQWLAPELAVRGGYESRDTRRQTRLLLAPGNDWLAIAQDYDEDVTEIGAGVLVAPGGLFTLALDYGHERFRSSDALQDDALGFASTSRSVGFAPSTDRSTGRIRIHGRIGDRAVVTGGFQVSSLEQVEPPTPAQTTAGFGSNSARVYSAQLAADVKIAERWVANAFVKVVDRHHDLDRSSALFDPTNGTQVAPFLEGFSRVDFGADLVYRPHRRTKLTLATRILHIDRDLEFAQAGLGNPIVLPENALVNDRSFSWSVEGRADLRPARGVGIRAELGYRDSPDTGYIVDLAGFVFGSLRATWVVPVSKPVTLSFHARGGSGENRNFRMVAGQGPGPPGPEFARVYERSHWNVGASADATVRENLTLFGSLFFSNDDRMEDLVLSNLQRHFQESVPLTFRTPGALGFQSDELGLVVGAHARFTPRTEGGLSYAFTRAESGYADSGTARELGLIDASRVIDADMHSLGFEVGHRVRDGLRVLAGYRLDHYADGARVPSSVGSVAAPFDRSDTRHYVTLGITVNDELFASRD